MSVLYSNTIIPTSGKGVAVPSQLYYRGSSGSCTATGSAVFPTSFASVVSNMGSAISLNPTGLTLTAPVSGVYSVSFSAAPGGGNGNPVSTVQITSTVGSSNPGNYILIDNSAPASWKPYSVTSYMSSGEVWTVALGPASGAGDYLVANIMIAQVSRSV